MKQLALLARFIHFTNILISAATAAICFQTALLLDWIYIPSWFYLFMFSNTFLQYGIHDLYSKKGSTNARPKFAFFLRHRPYFIFFIFTSLVVSAYLFFKLTPLQAVWLAILGLLTLLYSFPLLPFKRLRRFKDNGVLKLFILVLVWTLSVTVVPATFIPYGFDAKFWWLLVSRFFYMLAICIPFDVRDDMADAKTVRNTMVSLFGEKACYQLSYASLVMAAICFWPVVMAGIPIITAVAMFVSLAITAWMVAYSNRHRFSPNSYLMLDGSMILQTLLIWIAMLIP